mmetsp:Transcript_15106/g.30691  ORF Transcript_15106/g.30691 Transcript_15106/m.30691 type:complete len:81 (-) Transcript_15106:214-456(-)
MAVLRRSESLFVTRKAAQLLEEYHFGLNQLDQNGKRFSELVNRHGAEPPPLWSTSDCRLAPEIHAPWSGGYKEHQTFQWE